MSVDILGTNCDRCRSMVQYSFTSTETRRLVRTDSPGRPPQLSRSSWTMCDETCPFTLVTNANVYNQLEWWNVPMKFDNKCQCRKTMSSTRAVLKNLHAGGHVGSRNRKRGWDVKKKKKKKKKMKKKKKKTREKLLSKPLFRSRDPPWPILMTNAIDVCELLVRWNGPVRFWWRIQRGDTWNTKMKELYLIWPATDVGVVQSVMSTSFGWQIHVRHAMGTHLFNLCPSD